MLALNSSICRFAPKAVACTPFQGLRERWSRSSCRTLPFGHLAEARNRFSAVVRFSDALRLFAEDLLLTQTPIRFDTLRVFSPHPTCTRLSPPHPPTPVLPTS